MTNVLFVLALTGWSSLSFSQLKIPPSVQQDLTVIETRFFQVLEEECPADKCHRTGCQVQKFETLDQMQDNSLPGLETSATLAGTPQYRLAAVSCEFSYEPQLTAEFITSLRQRLNQRVKLAGVSLAITANRLQEKEDDKAQPEELTPVSEVQLPPQTWSDGLRIALVPFIPWFILWFLLLVTVIVVIWAIRKVGLRRDLRLRTRSGDLIPATTGDLATSEPSALMVLNRVAQIKGKLDEDADVAESAFRTYLESKNFDDLCLFLRHFEPRYLDSFREQSEFRQTLATLSEKYAAFDRDVPLGELWTFLDRFERSLVAAKVKVSHQPLANDFAFLVSLGVEELIALLSEMSDIEAITAITYAPASLREQVFTAAPPGFVVKVIEKLATVDRISDSFGRKTAKKLRQLYTERVDQLQTITVNRSPMLESALNSLKYAERRRVVDELKRDNPQLLDVLAPGLFLDESLLYVPEDLLTEAFLEVLPEDAAVFLANYDGGQKLLSKLNPKLAASLRKFNIKTVDQSIVSRVRERISAFIKRKDAEGKVDLRSITLSLLR